jgi:hypothetical protein
MLLILNEFNIFIFFQILERDRKKEFYDGHGRQSNRKRLKTSDEEQQEKSFVRINFFFSSSFEVTCIMTLM